MHKLMTAAGVAAALLAASAQAQEAEATGETGAEAPAEATAEVAYDAATVLATVDGTEITLGHVIVMRDRLPEQYQNIPDDVLLPGILEQLVDQTLLAAQESATAEEDPLEVRLHLENERRGTLAARAAQEFAEAPLDDAAVQTAYDAAFAEFEPQQEFSAAHILVETEEQAQDLKAEIDGGAEFAALAQEHSKDPGSGANGGELGWFGAGQMVPEFETAVAGLEAGEVSDPVESQFGWHVIRLNETRDTAPPPLDQVRPEIEDRLRQEAVQAEIEELRAASEVELVDPGIPPAAIRESDLVRN